MAAGGENFSGSALGRNGSKWQFARARERFVFGGVVALEFGVALRTGPHQTGRDRGNVNTVAGQFRAERVRETDESKLACGIRGHVGDGDFASNGRNVYDAAAAAPSHFRNNLHDQLKRRPKMQFHGTLEIFSRHVFERTDLDDPRVID